MRLPFCLARLKFWTSKCCRHWSRTRRTINTSWRSNSRIAANPAASCQAPLCSCCPRAPIRAESVLAGSGRVGSCRHCVGFARFRPLSGMYPSRPLDMTLGLNPSPAPTPVVTVEHLWMHVCDRAYVSHYRTGPCVGEPIPEEGLKRLNARPADFAPLPTAKSQGSPKPPIDVKTRSDQECCITTSNSLSSRRVKTRTVLSSRRANLNRVA